MAGFPLPAVAPSAHARTGQRMDLSVCTCSSEPNSVQGLLFHAPRPELRRGPRPPQTRARWALGYRPIHFQVKCQTPNHLAMRGASRLNAHELTEGGNNAAGSLLFVSSACPCPRHWANRSQQQDPRRAVQNNKASLPCAATPEPGTERAWVALTHPRTPDARDRPGVSGTRTVTLFHWRWWQLPKRPQPAQSRRCPQEPVREIKQEGLQLGYPSAALRRSRS